jgi:hypothetical protein
VLRFLAALADVTGESACLSPCAGLPRFLEGVQNNSGKFPYSVGIAAGDDRPHFQCY